MNIRVQTNGLLSKMLKKVQDRILREMHLCTKTLLLPSLPSVQGRATPWTYTCPSEADIGRTLNILAGPDFNPLSPSLLFSPLLLALLIAWKHTFLVSGHEQQIFLPLLPNLGGSVSTALVDLAPMTS